MSKKIAVQNNSDLIQFDNNQIEIIKNQFFPQMATPQDINYCMGVATSLGLNPITKEIYFVERKSKVGNQWVTKVEPLAGRDAYMKIAHRSGDFGGIESTTELREIPKMVQGKWQKETELVATAKVYKKGFENPFVVEVNYSEYVQKKQDGTPTKFWAEKPHTMLKKVAESQCLRKAFNITGIYTEEEKRGDIEEAQIMYEEHHHDAPTEPTLNELKTSLKNKLIKDYSFSLNDVKEFASVNKLSEDKAKIEDLLTDDSKLETLVKNFEMIMGQS